MARVSPLLLLPMLLLAVAASAQDSSQVAAAGGVQQGEVCEGCMLLKDYLVQTLPTDAAQQHLKDMVTALVCQGLDAPAAAHCAATAPALVPLIISWLQDRLTELCERPGICDTAAQAAEAATALAAGRANGFECPMCKVVVTKLLMDLQNPTEQANLLERAHGLCANIADSAVHADCDAMVEKYGRQAFAIIQDVSPDRLCTMVGVCDPDVPPTLLHGLPQGASADAFRQLADLHTRAPGGTALAADENCDTCKAIVTEVAVILRNPDTQQQILAYAREACSTLQQYKDQCVMYVDMYGPLAFGLVMEYLQPVPLCAKLGYCPVAPVPPSGGAFTLRPASGQAQGLTAAA